MLRLVEAVGIDVDAKAYPGWCVEHVEPVAEPGLWEVGPAAFDQESVTIMSA